MQTLEEMESGEDCFLKEQNLLNDLFNRLYIAREQCVGVRLSYEEVHAVYLFFEAGNSFEEKAMQYEKLNVHERDEYVKND